MLKELKNSYNHVINIFLIVVFGATCFLSAFIYSLCLNGFNNRVLSAPDILAASATILAGLLGLVGAICGIAGACYIFYLGVLKEKDEFRNSRSNSLKSLFILLINTVNQTEDAMKLLVDEHDSIVSFAKSTKLVFNSNFSPTGDIYNDFTSILELGKKFNRYELLEKPQSQKHLIEVSERIISCTKNININYTSYNERWKEGLSYINSDHDVRQISLWLDIVNTANITDVVQFLRLRDFIIVFIETANSRYNLNLPIRSMKSTKQYYRSISSK